MEDLLFECEGCVSQAQNDAATIRVVIVTTSAVGVLISWAILVLLLMAKSIQELSSETLPMDSADSPAT